MKINIINNNAILWILATIFTLSIAVYQKKTGPTYAISGKATLGTTNFSYDINRTHGGDTDHQVSVNTNNKNISGIVVWKRYKFEEPLHKIVMDNIEGVLTADLPYQPPAGKLEYQVILTSGSEKLRLPETLPAVIRFKGAVPWGILLPHVIFMFAGLLIAMRAMLGSFVGLKSFRLPLLTLILIFLGGLVFGPIVQKYAFGAYWTGWPFGEDLTDNKTLVMAVAWIIAVWRINTGKTRKSNRWWIIGATIVTFWVYLIPHSMRGSELDYNTLDSDSLKVSQKQVSPAPEIE